MGDTRDGGPKLTLLIGCEGSGRTGWRRANRDLLPELFLDADGLADALGGWESRDARERGAELLRRELENAFAERRDVGLKADGCKGTITVLTERARRAGFRVEGTYIGTVEPEINGQRIQRRVAALQGPGVSREHIASRYRQALRALRETAARFDEVTVLDNTEPAGERGPEPRTELVIERGAIVYEARRLSAWTRGLRQAITRASEPRRRRRPTRQPNATQGRDDDGILRFSAREKRDHRPR